MTTQDDSPACKGEREEELRSSLLTYHWMKQLHIWLASLDGRRPTDADFPSYTPHYVPLTLSLALTSITLLLLLFLDYDPPASAWVYLYLGALIFMVFWSAETIIRKVISLLRGFEQKLQGEQSRPNVEPQPSTEEIQKKLARLDKLCEDLHLGQQRYQALPGVGLAILVVLLLPILFQQIFGELPGWPLYVLAAVTGFFWGSAGYISAMSSLQFTKYLDIDLFHLYAFNPQKSPVVNDLSDVYETALWANSVSVVVLLLPMVFVLRTPLLVLAGAFVSVITFGILIGLFVFAQTSLARLIRHRKEEVATDLQSRVEKIYDQAKSADGAAIGDLQEKLEFFMGLHDQVIKTPGWGLSTTRPAKYLRAFVLPTIVALYANRELIRAIYNASIEWLFN